MKSFSLIILLLATSFLCISQNKSNTANTNFTGPYLGKQPPGLVPALFDNGQITGKPNAFNFSFSPDGKELFFSINKGTKENPYFYEIQHMVCVDSIWTAPETAFFSGKNSDVDITFSPDGKRVYFISDRHNPDKDSDIYYLDKNNGEWSQPIRIKGEVNTPNGAEMHASISKDGTFVFRSTRPGGFGGNDLYLADYKNGEFINVRNMGPGINTEYLESDCFIDQNGEYIVYNAIRPENNNKPQIFVTFNLGNDKWSKGVPLGKEVNSKDGTIGSTITPDGKYLIYSARYGEEKGRYWISTYVIKKLHPRLIKEQ